MTKDVIDHERRKRQLAKLVSEGMGVSEAGRYLGMTRGSAVRQWQNIKRDLGWQAQ